MATSSTFTDSILAKAKALAAAAGVELVIDPEGRAFVLDGNQLRIPPIEALVKTYPNSSDLEAFLTGGVVHDCGHKKWTNFAQRKRFADSFAHHPSASLASIIGHVMEDVSVDRNEIQAVPAHESVIQALWEVLVDRLESVVAADAETNAFQRYVLYRARCSVLSFPELQKAHDRATQRFWAVTSTETFDMVSKACDDIDQISSTADGVKTAQRVLQAFGVSSSQFREDGQEKAPEGPASGSSQDAPAVDSQDAGTPEPTDQETAAADSSAKREGDVDPKPLSNADSVEPSETPASNTVEGQQAGETGEQDATGEAANSSTSSDKQPEGDADASSGSDASGGESGGDATSEEIVLVGEATDDGKAPKQSGEKGTVLIFGQQGTSDLASKPIAVKQSAGQRLRDKVQRDSMLASAKLGHALKAQTQSTVTYGKSGKLVPSRLWKIKTGNLNVFKREVEGRDFSTAIEVLLDSSYSMASDIKEAVRAMAFLALAMDAIPGIETSCHVFPGAVRAAVQLKRFNEHVAETLDKMASVEANGGTPMLAAMSQVVKPLYEHSADRKILLVIADGLPPSEQEGAECATLTRKLESSGVEVIAIGIGAQTRRPLSKIFNTTLCINNVSELTDMLYQVLQESFVMKQAA